MHHPRCPYRGNASALRGSTGVHNNKLCAPLNKLTSELNSELTIELATHPTSELSSELATKLIINLTILDLTDLWMNQF